MMTHRRTGRRANSRRRARGGVPRRPKEQQPTLGLVIVWLNGAFGVGKTSVARELVTLLPDARISDPERIGFVMRRTLWRRHDYQEVELWRALTRRQAARASRRGTAVVPMTVVRRDVFADLTNGARVFLLTASRAALEHRIATSEEAREWRTQNVDRCLKAFERGGFGEPVATDGRSPLEVARSIAAQL